MQKNVVNIITACFIVLLCLVCFVWYGFITFYWCTNTAAPEVVRGTITTFIYFYGALVLWSLFYLEGEKGVLSS